MNRNIFLALLICFFTEYSFAQFKSVHADRLSFYKYKGDKLTNSLNNQNLGLLGPSGDYIPIMIQSTQNVGTDTVYINYNVLGFNDPITASCEVTSKSPSWLGRKIIMTNEQQEIFINLNGDSLVFWKYASLDESWKFFNSENGYFEATVLKKGPETFYINNTAVIDSVLTFVIHFKDKETHLVAEHIFNGRIWKISKAYGFVKTYDILNFPKDTNSLVLAGDDKFHIGVKNLTEKDIHNYEVGDEFHITYNKSSPSSHGTFYFGASYINKVLKKSLIGDTLVYEMQQIIVRDGSVSTVIIKVPVKGSTNFIETIPLTPMRFSQRFDIPPIFAGYNYQIFDTTMGVISKVSRNFEYNSKTEDTFCYSDTLRGLNWESQYLEGLGGPYYHDVDNGYYEIRRLDYYKKGNKEWGTPYNISLVVFANKLKASIILSPNPVTDQIRISSEEIQNTFYKVYNIEGKETMDGSFSSGDEIINVNSLRTGIYSIMIMKEGEVVYTSRFLKN
jgi:hypothetical protein